MITKSLDFGLKTPDATQALAQRFAPHLQPGDTVLLDGEIGAGKTFFARALLSEILLTPEDVPSPTFTIVQTYETKCGEVWHTDLYRLQGGSDVIEIGLPDAFEETICLIEWPDRLGDMTPESALTLHFSVLPNDEERHLKISWLDARWDETVKDVFNARP